jgi:hypothetical protein
MFSVIEERMDWEAMMLLLSSGNWRINMYITTVWEKLKLVRGYEFKKFWWIGNGWWDSVRQVVLTWLKDVIHLCEEVSNVTETTILWKSEIWEDPKLKKRLCIGTIFRITLFQSRKDESVRKWNYDAFVFSECLFHVEVSMKFLRSSEDSRLEWEVGSIFSEDDLHYLWVISYFLQIQKESFYEFLGIEHIPESGDRRRYITEDKRYSKILWNLSVPCEKNIFPKWS